MKYKIIKEVEIDEATSKMLDAAAHCVLDLLYDRLVDVDAPDNMKTDEYDINYDFNAHGLELAKMREDAGYTTDKLVSSADTFVRGL